jgi:hypothetical protein
MTTALHFALFGSSFDLDTARSLRSDSMSVVVRHPEPALSCERRESCGDLTVGVGVGVTEDAHCRHEVDPAMKGDRTPLADSTDRAAQLTSRNELDLEDEDR